jgi:hypothetical protein
MRETRKRFILLRTALQEMGGWKSTEMVRRYAHLAPAHMMKHAEVMGNLISATNTAQG